MEDLLQYVQQAHEVLRQGGTILYPTDTIWGLGCDATRSEAVEKIIEIKQRPANKSFIVLMASEQMMQRYVAEIPEITWQLLEVANQPLTLIFPKGLGVAAEVLGPDGSIAVRIPRLQFCQSLLHRLRRPLLSTSANISGEKAPSRFSGINPALMAQVDWAAPAHLEKGSTGSASSIIKLGPTGEVEIIRP